MSSSSVDLDQPTAEEFIQHYAQNYSSLKKALKFKETFSEVEPKLLHKALRFTSNLPGDLYTPAECIEQIEYFTQQIKKNLILNMVQIYIMKGWKFSNFYTWWKNSWQIFSKNSFITMLKVKAAEMTVVKKKMQKILHKILSKKLYFFIF